MSQQPWLDDGDVVLHHGDALEQLALMPSESVQCAITSPPFFQLRNYGVAGQIGLEATLADWLASLVAVFAELKRVLRSDGTFWCEIGDTFVDKQLAGAPWRLAFALQEAGWFLRSDCIWARLPPNPMPESVTDRPTKAHSYVFLLSKSARYFMDMDAIREPHEVGPNTHSIGKRGSTRGLRKGTDGMTREPFAMSGGGTAYNPAGRNARSVWNIPEDNKLREHLEAIRDIALISPDVARVHAKHALLLLARLSANPDVWSIPTEPTPFAHFATFPQALVERCVKAGTSEHGACSECGAPWRRITERGIVGAQVGNNARADDPHGGRNNRDGFAGKAQVSVDTLGWEPACAHDAPVTPCIVCDPFMGSGTTALVARRLGRHAIGIELSADYLRIAAKRLQQPTLWSQPV